MSRLIFDKIIYISIFKQGGIMALFRIAKRVFLFAILNILVIITLSITLNILGIKGYLTNYGIDYYALMVFCLIWGMGGAFISLMLSRIMAKWMMGVHVIDPDTRDPELRWLLDTVYKLSRQAGLSKMPEVGIYESREINAFATGPTRNRALVAVSSGLLESMSEEEIEAARSTVRNLDWTVEAIMNAPPDEDTPEFTQMIYDLRQGFLAALEEDLNIPKALGELFKFMKRIRGIIEYRGISDGMKEEILGTLKRVDEILGILDFEPHPQEPLIRSLVQERADHRAKRQWQEADAIRERLRSMGIELMDCPSGTLWTWEKVL
jgi:hypothetical protein